MALIDPNSESRARRRAITSAPARKPARRPTPMRGLERVRAAVSALSTRLDELAKAPPSRPTPTIAILPPPLDNLPPAPRIPYLGGGADMATLHDALNYCEARSAAIIAASGREGVGASALALAYCARYRKAYERVWLVRAGSRWTLLNDLASLARSMAPDDADNHTVPDQAALAIDLMSAHAPGAPNLIVFDDAPGPEELARWTPRGGARVLVVSRDEAWVGRTPTVLVGSMDTAVARKLAHRASGRRFDTGLRAITGTTQDLPLALTIAAAFLRENRNVSSAAYAARYADAARRAVGDMDTRTAATTIGLTLEHVARVAPTAPAIIRLAAHFDLARIPFTLIVAAAPYLPRAVLSARSGALAALRVLHAHGLVEVDETGPEPVLSLHAIVRRVARANDRTDPNTPVWADAAVKGARRVLASCDTQARTRQLVPHLLALLAGTPSDAGGFARDELVLELGRRLAADGDHVTAEPLLRAVMTRSATKEAEGQALLRRCMTQLARTLVATGRAREAERLARRAFLLAENAVDGGQNAQTDAVELLADLLASEGRYGEAEPWARRAARAADRRRAPIPERITARRRLARIYQELQRHRDAEALLQQVLEMSERAFERRDLHIAAALAALANARLYGESPSEATALVARALDVCSWSVGPNHPVTRVGGRALVRLHRSFGEELDARVAAGRYGVDADEESDAQTAPRRARLGSANKPLPEGSMGWSAFR